MFCLRDFDFARAYNEPNLFKLYAEIQYGIKQRLCMEDQVKMHVANSNYGHRGNGETAKFYEWKDLTDYVVEASRFEHEFLHVCLAILAEEEGWSPFCADGNHIAEAMVIEAEAFVRLWDPYSPKKVTDFSVYQKAVTDTYSHYVGDDKQYYSKGWLAASESATPMTAFEARFLGVLPKQDWREVNTNSGAINKWGEAAPSFEIDRDKTQLFHERLGLLRSQLLDALKAGHCYPADKRTCQEFLKTLKMDEIAQIMNGQSPDHELSYDLNRVATAKAQSLQMGRLASAL